MGEPVWTTLEIGGRITQPILDQLVDLMKEHFDEDCYCEPGHCLTYTGQQNYGEVDNCVLDFLTDNGLTWKTHWEGVGGVTDAGYKAWRPGLEHPVGGACDTDGDPVITLSDLVDMAEKGHSIHAVIYAMQRIDVEVPPLEIISHE